MWLLFIFFFFKQKTAYEMRISDWSSDVVLFRSPVAPRATAENKARSGASAPPKARSDHSWRRLLSPPLNQHIVIHAHNLIGPEPSYHQCNVISDETTCSMRIRKYST